MKNFWRVLTIVAVVILALVFFFASFGMLMRGAFITRGMPGGFGRLGMMGGVSRYGMFGGAHPFGGLAPFFFFLLLIAAVVLFIYWVIRSERAPSSAAPVASTQLLDTLKMRYAKGEINKDQLDRKSVV